MLAIIDLVQNVLGQFLEFFTELEIPSTGNTLSDQQIVEGQCIRRVPAS